MSFPKTRLRRLRYNPILRDLVSETSLSLNDLIYPIFICEGENVKIEIPSMPGQYNLSIDNAVELCKIAVIKGVKSFLLFGVPDKKDEHGHLACLDNSIVQRAIKSIKKECNNILLIADVCNCEYTTHGHCGTIIDGDVDNDLTLETLASQSVSLAKAGADIIAPSDMMDGRVAIIRKALDNAGYEKTPILSYAVKYSSAFYGPFRNAVNSSPTFGNRNTYQMNPTNKDEAMREVEQDVFEGADMLMVKPALSYLDIISKVKNNFDLPLVAYNVSGEYAIVKAAAANNWIDEQRMIMEIITSIKRAGADIIITYHALELADILNKKK